MLRYKVFVLIVALICPVWSKAIASRALASPDSTSSQGPGGYCTGYIEAYSVDEETWMKFHHCIWVNPDKSALLFTYIDDVQYKPFFWRRPSSYNWFADIHWYGKTIASNHGTASGKNVKKEIGKIDNSIKPGRHVWYIGLQVLVREASQGVNRDMMFTFDIDS